MYPFVNRRKFNIITEKLLWKGNCSSKIKIAILLHILISNFIPKRILIQKYVLTDIMYTIFIIRGKEYEGNKMFRS